MRARDAELTLRLIAGFKGETREDGDPDSAPRKVDLLVTDDGRMMPLSITVPVFFMPLVIQFVHSRGRPVPGKKTTKFRLHARNAQFAVADI
jgi:hypothetical protein